MTETEIQNWMTFLGLLLLGIKTVSEGRRKRALNEIEAKIDARGADEATIVSDIQDIILERRKKANRWTPSDGVLMWAGYGLLIGGNLWRIF
jgi:hypothetical protein